MVIVLCRWPSPKGITISLGYVGLKKTDESNPKNEVSLDVETGQFSRTCSEAAALEGQNAFAATLCFA